MAAGDREVWGEGDDGLLGGGFSKRRPESFWREVVAEYDASSLGAKDFCCSMGLALSTFHKWRLRLLAPKAPPQKIQSNSAVNDAQFLPIYLATTETPHQQLTGRKRDGFSAPVENTADPSGLIIHLAESLSISIAKDFHAPTLRRLVKILSPRAPLPC